MPKNVIKTDPGGHTMVWDSGADGAGEGSHTGPCSRVSEAWGLVGSVGSWFFLAAPSEVGKVFEFPLAQLDAAVSYINCCLNFLGS